MATDYKRTVLIVDSEWQWRARLDLLLCEEFLVTVVGSYTEALGLLQKQGTFYHVVITEISLDEGIEGNQDGFNLVNKANATGQNIQSIILTRSSSVSETRIAFVKYKVNDLIEKANFNEAEFLAVVRKAAELAEKDVFLIMPFSEKFIGFHEQIEEIVIGMGLECHRADDVFKPNAIMTTILTGLKRCGLAIADLSGHNPNVYFETGIAHALGKKVILLTRDEADVQGTLRSVRYLTYTDSLAGATKLKSELSKAILDVRVPHSQGLERVENSLEEDLCVVLTRNDEDGQQTYRQIIEPVLKSFDLRAIQLSKVVDTRTLLEAKQAKLHASRFLLADVYNKDADIFYQAGYAYGLGKDVIYLARSQEDIPSDLRASFSIIYSKESRSAMIEAKKSLKVAIQVISIKSIGSEKLNSKVRPKRVATGKTKHGGAVKKNRTKISVFLNHANEDKPLVKNLYARLKKVAWIDPWFDEIKLLPGHDWALEIENAMNKSDACLICISEISIKKIGYVQAEIRKAEEQQKLRPAGSIYMIPVLLEKCSVPTNLKKYQWVDISQPGQVDKIIKSLETLR